MTELDFEDLQLMVRSIEGLRGHLDLFIHDVTLELETIQVKLNRILKEVQPPTHIPVSMST
jgi:hypothetical protein